MSLVVHHPIKVQHHCKTPLNKIGQGLVFVIIGFGEVKEF